MKRYDHAKIEKKWQKNWAKKGLAKTRDRVKGKKNHYILTEFPYPSGNLHVGHWYAFAMPDILVRTMRMQGKNVLYPIGFDAFGLPAENAAIKRGLDPRKWTLGNIKYMKGQLASMGASFDWSREVQTIDPQYYRWTQWMFTQFLKKGLAYRKETPANWCPSCKTVLANEQVVSGACERCGSIVEQRNMLQWNLRITDYADRLIDDLDTLDWPQQIKDSQKNWIGRSEGAEIGFEVRGSGLKEMVTVFTTRPDTLFGATYLVLAPEHPLVQSLCEGQTFTNAEEVREYIAATKRKSDLERQEGKEKTGVKLEGVGAINPATGGKIPMYIADYVLAHYGTGAIMAVPAHDERDFEFAKKFGLPIREVVVPDRIDANNPPITGKSLVARRTIQCYLRRDDGMLLAIDWKQMGWKTVPIGGVEEGEDIVEAGRRELREETGYTDVRFVRELGDMYAGYFAKHKDVNRRAHVTGLLFELTSDSQESIAPEEAEKHEPRWIPIEEARKTLIGVEPPVYLPRLDVSSWCYPGEGTLVNSGAFSGLSWEEAKRQMTAAFGTPKKTYRLRDWIVSRQRYWGVPIPVIHCPQCGAVPVPDKDLPVKLPVVKDYLPSGDGKSPLAKAEKWKKVKCPQCTRWAERETDTLDTFVDSSWYFLRYADPKNKKVFADRQKMKAWMPVDLYSGGAEHTTMHLLYSRFWHKALFDLKLVNESEPYARRMNRGLIMGPDGQKMSKSRGNVIDPDEIVKRLGADTVRMYLAFIGPYNETGSYPWNPDGVVGVRRFLERVWKLGQPENEKGKPAIFKELEPSLHRTIKKVSDDIAGMKFNTAIAALMTFLNEAEKEGISRAQFDTFLQLLAPFAPHITEELWHLRGHKNSIHLEKWPKADSKKMQALTVTIAVQINGKMRGTVSAQTGASESEVLDIVRAHAPLAAYIADTQIRRVILIPDRLINIIV